MALSLNYTDINTCEGADWGSWTAINSATDLRNSTAYNSARRQGTQCGEFFRSGSGGYPATCGYQTPTITAFDVRNYEVGAWMMNPIKDGANANVLPTGTGANSGVRLRLYSGANWADYYQDQHLLEAGTANANWQGGWLYLRAGGAAGTEDANSGTWTNTQAAAVDSIAIIIELQVQLKTTSDPGIGIDWYIYYDKILVEGYNGGTTPWTLDDINDMAVSRTSGGGIWGVWQKFANFHLCNCPIQFGSDVATAGAFEALNESLYLYGASEDHPTTITVKDDFEAVFGEKNDTGAVQNYAQKGCTITAATDVLHPPASPSAPTPNFTVENGGILKCYATLIENFGTINLGSGGSEVIEFIKVDLYNNTTLELRSTGLSFQEVKMHFPGTAKAAIGSIYSDPKRMFKIDVFQVTNGLACRVDGMKMKQYNVKDATTHLLLLDNQTVNLVDSNLDWDTIDLI